MPLRGLVNSTGVACHVSTALWILYSVEPFRRSVLLVGKTKRASVVVLELARVWDPSNDHIDPSRLYRQLRYANVVNARNPGDTVTTLSRILTFLRKDEVLSDVVDALFFSGKMHSTLIGKQSNGDEQLRQLGSKTVPAPWSLTFNLEANCSLLDVCLSVSEEKVMRDYIWKSSSNDCDVCCTTKVLHVESLPPVLFIHVNRNPHPFDTSFLEIPTVISAQLLCPCNGQEQYHLLGGIALVRSDDDDDDDSDHGEGDHVVALIRDHDAEWQLVDDETVTLVTEQEVLGMLGGCQRPHLAGSDSLSQTMGILFAYQQETHLDTVDRILEDKSLKVIDWEHPESIMSSRIRVQWSRGKWYKGRIKRWRDCMYEVVYDDGETKWHNLAETAFEWEKVPY